VNHPAPAPPHSHADADPGAALEVRIARTGEDLLEAFRGVLGSVPDQPQGPQALAKRIHIDKVLASRLLKAVRSPDAMSVLHRMPGPEPLRRVLRAASKQGADADLVERAERAVARFEGLIRDDLGDRGALDAIVSAWVPEARREFELRRKQTAYRAMSQLKGAEARAILATVVLHPAADGQTLDIVWINGLIGLHRIRPGAAVKLVTRRIVPEESGRAPFTLSGDRIEEGQLALYDDYCSDPPPRVELHRAGDVIHYTLADGAFGPGAVQDVVTAEVNRGEMRRYVPRETRRKGYVFAEAALPARALQLDAIVHREVYPGSDPTLRLYDTAFEGVADVNDPGREIDQLDLLESVEFLGQGVARIGSSVVPRYTRMIGDVFARLGWDRSAYRAYRCLIDYPVYGTQVALCFDPPQAAGGEVS